MRAMLKELVSDFDDDLIGIPEETVFGDLNINTDAVKKMVLVGSGCNKSRKPFGRAVRLTLIAAVIAAAFVMTSTIICASGDFQLAFEEFFGGSMNSDGLYDGGDVAVKTPDPNLDVSFLGVTGDEHEMYAVIKAVKKDGGTFTDEGYGFPYTICRNDDMRSYLESLNGKDDSGFDKDEILSKLSDFYGIGAVIKDRYGNNFGYNQDGRATTDSQYYLSEDRKTIKILFHLDVDAASGTKHLDPRDGTATITAATFMAQKITKTIMTDDHINDDVYKKFTDECKKLDIDPLDCKWLYTQDKVIFCQVEEKEYSLPFELTFKMNYRYSGNIKKELSASDAPHFIKAQTTNVKMTVSPFSIRIYGESSNVNDMKCFENADADNSKVIMKDGSVRYFEDRGGAGGGGIGSGRVEEEHQLIYQEKPHLTIETKKILIDTRQIKQIIINGDTLYTSDE